MDHIEADEFDYKLTDKDYRDIYTKLELIERSITDSMWHEGNFSIPLVEGELQVYYKIKHTESYATYKGDVDKYLSNIEVVFCGTDRDGAEWERDVTVDYEKLYNINQNCDQLLTVHDLVKFLQTLDQSARLSAEYIQVAGSTFVDIKERTLLKSLFVPDGEKKYKIKAMFY